MMNLSNEYLLNVLRRLSLTDRINMRAVSKRFRTLIDENWSISELVFCSDYRLKFFHRWWYTWQEIDPSQHYCVAFNLSFETPILQHLKKLKIKDDLVHADLVRLQRFTELQQLEIGRLVFSGQDETVSFPNLRILWVQQILRPDDQGRYTLDSPNLTAVFFGGFALNHIAPIRRESVEHLEFQFDQISNKDSLKFENVKVVKIHQALDLHMNILNKLIVKMPYIEELHLNLFHFTDLNSDSPYAAFPAFESRLKILHDVSVNLKTHRESKKSRGKLDIYLQGVLIQEDLPDPCKFIFQRLLMLHYNCYTRVYRHLPTVVAVYYLDTIQVSQVVPPLTFLRRYPHIEFVEASKGAQPYASHFLEFLNGLNRITALSVRFAEFPQQFYDLLPKVRALRALVTLIVLDKIVIDFSFIKQFSLLTTFKTNLMSANSALDLLSELNSHGDYEFCFQNGNRAVVIKRAKADTYLLAIYQRPQSSTLWQKLHEVMDNPQMVSILSPDRSVPSGENEAALFDEPLAGYTRSIYENFSLEKVAAKFRQKSDILGHWLERSTAGQSP